MKFQCECGHVIHDVTDYQDNKARFVPDETHEAMLESIDEGLDHYSAFRKYQRHMFQCVNCCRLHVMNNEGEFISFKPDNKINFGILKGLVNTANT